MERKLLKKLYNKYLFVLIALLTFGFMGAQTISYSWDLTEPNVFNFVLTNGTGGAHFTTSTQYRLQISTTPNFVSGTFDNIQYFNLNNPPVGDGTSQSYQRNFSIPNDHALNFHTYSTVYVRVLPITPTVRIDGIPVEVIYDVSIEGLTDMGYVKCQTPAVSYRLATVRNTGNLPQAYDLSLDQNITPTEQNLASDILSLQGNPINSTPELGPGAKFSFLVRIAAIQGTQPDKNNYNGLTATAQSDSTINDYEVIHTWTYCGNDNNIPDNPDAPDLILSKTGPNPNVAVIGEQMTYTLSLINNSTREAIFPTITDSIPVNLDIVDIYKDPSDTRNISITFDDITRVLEVTYPTDKQNTFVTGEPPINIYIDVIPNCYVTPQVVNTAYASNGAGDSNNESNEDTVNTDIFFDTSNEVDWTGKVNDDWFECANWDKGIVPDEDINATIPTEATNNPIIDSGSLLAPLNGTAEVRDLTIMQDKSLYMNSATLEVNGNWTNNGGTLIPGNGTVAFVGSDTDQTIFDLSEEPSFYNLTINTSNDVKVLITDVYNEWQGLHVNNQLNLENGVLRLEGMSQLIQPDGASVVANTGKLLRDQKGQANMYNYNYWSSPVGNLPEKYVVNSVMKDGTDITNPQNIQWTGSYNGAPTTPITISATWLWTFESSGPDYANWQKVNHSTTELSAGQGYTMKGSGATGDFQNYTFVGVPFTGNITHTISDGQITLLGNPYASALDADQFILDNTGVIDGTLEFWDHFQTTNSHHLDQYMGGYAKYNWTEQIEAVNVVGVSGTKIPQQFIPVGQGFFVAAAEGISSNSQIEFKNSQRAFVKEDDTGGMQMFGIPDGTNTSAGTFDGPTKIKLNMISAGDYKHQIAIGFMQDNATEEIDYGYDAKLRDTDPNQFYFMHPDEKLLIQGVGYFDEDKNYPLGVISEFQGRYTFSIDHIKNLDENTPVYLYDNEKQIYHNLRKSDYLVNLSKGEHNTRFSLRFKNHIQDNNQSAQEMLNTIVVYRQSDFVVISNPAEQITVLNARMYNVLGQEVTTWSITNGRENYIELPLGPVASGIYVVQVQTDNGVVSKKINIR